MSSNGKKPTILITAGPTREYIDPVRYLSNASSGIMGYEIAKCAVKSGYKVTVISGPVSIEKPAGVNVIDVVSALDMFKAFKKEYKKADIIIGAAAVSDYRPLKTSKEKIKKISDTLSLKLVKNPDIIKFAGSNKGKKVLAGFSLESQNIIKNSLNKLKNKNMDFVVCNYPSAIGKNVSTAWLINKNGTVISLKNKNKKVIAKRIIDEALGLFKNN